jgi:hypothetical protein
MACEPRLLDERIDELADVRDVREQPLDRDRILDRARPREVDRR